MLEDVNRIVRDLRGGAIFIHTKDNATDRYFLEVDGRTIYLPDRLGAHVRKSVSLKCVAEVRSKSSVRKEYQIPKITR